MVAGDLLHIEWEAFEREASEREAVVVCYCSCPSGYMALAAAAVGPGMVAVLLGDWDFLRTWRCSYGPPVLEIEVSVHIGSWTRHHMHSKLLHVPGLCGLESGQPVPAACSRLQLVVAVESPVQVNGL